MVLILFNLKLWASYGPSSPSAEIGPKHLHIGIGMIPSEIVPKGNQYEMFNSLLEWIRRFKAKISREFNRF